MASTWCSGSSSALYLWGLGSSLRSSQDSFRLILLCLLYLVNCFLQKSTGTVMPVLLDYAFLHPGTVRLEWLLLSKKISSCSITACWDQEQLDYVNWYNPVNPVNTVTSYYSLIWGYVHIQIWPGYGSLAIFRPRWELIEFNYFLILLHFWASLNQARISANFHI